MFVCIQTYLIYICVHECTCASVYLNTHACEVYMRILLCRYFTACLHLSLSPRFSRVTFSFLSQNDEAHS